MTEPGDAGIHSIDDAVTDPFDVLIQRTYMSCEDDRLSCDYPYAAKMGLTALPKANVARIRRLIRLLQERGLICITRDDSEELRWHLTIDGVEYAEEAGIVPAEVAQLHREARLSLINRYLDIPSDEDPDRFPPELLAANALFIVPPHNPAAAPSPPDSKKADGSKQ